MAISAEHRSKFAALHWQWWRLQISEKFSPVGHLSDSGDLKNDQNKKKKKEHKKELEPV